VFLKAALLVMRRMPLATAWLSLYKHLAHPDLREMKVEYVYLHEFQNAHQIQLRIRLLVSAFQRAAQQAMKKMLMVTVWLSRWRFLAHPALAVMRQACAFR
jgi:hypothetical protein